MALQGLIESNPGVSSRYELVIATFDLIRFTEVDGLSHELEKIEAPDGTSHSSGVEKFSELTVKVASHHATDIAQMDSWYRENHGNVSSTAKKIAVLVQLNNQGLPMRKYKLTGVWCNGHDGQSNSMETSEMSVDTYKLCVDRYEAM